jgi:hypothetical protein
MLRGGVEQGTEARARILMGQKEKGKASTLGQRLGIHWPDNRVFQPDSVYSRQGPLWSLIHSLYNILNIFSPEES